MTPYYKHGPVTLYKGDCREVLKEIEPATVALLLTDPPYGIKVESDQFTDAATDWDDGDPTELIDAMLAAARPCMKTNGAFYVFGHPGQFMNARQRGKSSLVSLRRMERRGCSVDEGLRGGKMSTTLQPCTRSGQTEQMARRASIDRTCEGEIMKTEYIFPTVLIALDVAAAIVYATHGDWKHFGYWISAASISIFATIM